MPEIIDNNTSLVYNDYPVGKYATKYEFWTSNDGVQIIAGWRQAGLTIKEVYQKIGIDPRTFMAWRKKYPVLEDALVVSKEVADIRVVNSLYKRAVGYDYAETTEELVEGELRVTKIVHKHMPPDVKAILSWLFNRCSNDWRATQDPIDAVLPDILAANNVLVAIKKEVDNER